MKRLVAIALLPLLLAAFAPQQTEGKPRLSVAERRQLSSDITSAVVGQLLEKGCWTGHADMAEARRLRATFRIWLDQDGRFSAPPQLVEPAKEPAQDAQMKLFIAHARRALEMCNGLGWQLPEGSAYLLKDNYIDIQFVPKIGAP